MHVPIVQGISQWYNVIISTKQCMKDSKRSWALILFFCWAAALLKLALGQRCKTFLGKEPQCSIFSVLEGQRQKL